MSLGFFGAAGVGTAVATSPLAVASAEMSAFELLREGGAGAESALLSATGAFGAGAGADAGAGVSAAGVTATAGVSGGMATIS